MEQAIIIAVLCMSAFGVIGPAVARRTTPSTATWLLTAGGLLAAFSGVTALGLLAMTIVGQNAEIAQYGHWSIAALRRGDPIATPIAWAALAALALLSLRAAMVIIRRGVALRAAYETCHHLPAHGGLVVLPHSNVDAYAIPGRPGRVVVTRGMLQLLDGDERRALLEHERSHLRHGHHWHVAAAAVAAALNPLLTRLPAATSYATERWADEDAARVVPRPTAARALAHAAAAGPPMARRPKASLAAASVAVAARVSALEASPARPRPVLLATAVLTVVAVVVATIVAAEQTAELFVAAMNAAGQGR
jgi:Zn-dependent protease with chaperone function